ncbi:DNA polymerase III subunit alpha [Paroceanicella profunda]|uniref:Error-prone DNA polymerase n=2 Tax=Paroceanicella profunda TaxID=2579971 RepID=A0A5B8FVL0_9RHOB|nr:DNA polymerase III subunit alpha [Paroceanicella profunda]
MATDVWSGATGVGDGAAGAGHGPAPAGAADLLPFRPRSGKRRRGPPGGPPAYGELACTTNFSFLRGASHARELVARAVELGHVALGVADRNTLAGVVRAHVAAKAAGLRLLVGARLVSREGFETLCYPTDRAAYGRLSRLLTAGKRAAPKGECDFGLDDLLAHAQGQVFIALPPAAAAREADFALHLAALGQAAPGRVWLGLAHRQGGDDRARMARLAALAARAGLPLVAHNDVHYHDPARRPLQDVLTCIREGVTVAEAGFRLAANAERHLKPAAEMARLFAAWPGALAAIGDILALCRFSLDELAYNYPSEPVPKGTTPQAHLEALARAGAAARYRGAVPSKVTALLEKEIALIGELGYAPYFLTVHDMVAFARSRGILCQGRGSAANSAVCYCLGITAVDPAKSELLFERFISRARKEPPDIDVDFEHERREEVIQHVYARYGRHRAALAATVISYRPRSAVRDVGRAMGLTEDVTAALASTVWGSWGDELPAEEIRAAGLDLSDPLLARTVALTTELLGFPRHLSQHVGGFVLTEDPLEEIVPIGNAAMADRTFIEWDKDDIEALGILKVDVLALGMLSCLARAFGMLRAWEGVGHDLASIPPDDPRVYDMLSAADAIGVFQVESRAQLNMLPRLRPKVFYDLVIEVAIVRPGPIQGDMVHPYLRRRDGLETVHYPSPAPEHGDPQELRRVLDRTLGVPLFQEQAMQIAITAAEFTGDEANELRRAMATFRNPGTIHALEERMVGRMIARGYTADFASRCFEQIKGFGQYGFPESHAASFAILVYASAWVKCHHPAIFCAALLNSQPMGFYAPAQLVRDARGHGVEVRPVDVLASDWDCTLEPGEEGSAVRLGFRMVDGLPEAEMRAFITRRAALMAAAPGPTARRDTAPNAGGTAPAGGEATASPRTAHPAAGSPVPPARARAAASPQGPGAAGGEDSAHPAAPHTGPQARGPATSTEQGTEAVGREAAAPPGGMALAAPHLAPQVSGPATSTVQGAETAGSEVAVPSGSTTLAATRPGSQVSDPATSTMQGAEAVGSEVAAPPGGTDMAAPHTGPQIPGPAAFTADGAASADRARGAPPGAAHRANSGAVAQARGSAVSTLRAAGAAGRAAPMPPGGVALASGTPPPQAHGAGRSMVQRSRPAGRGEAAPAGWAHPVAGGGGARAPRDGTEAPPSETAGAAVPSGPSGGPAVVADGGAAPGGGGCDVGPSVLPGGDGCDVGPPVLPGGDGCDVGAPAMPGGDGCDVGAPAMPGGDGCDVVPPALPGGDGCSVAPPALPGGAEGDVGAPALPGGAENARFREAAGSAALPEARLTAVPDWLGGLDAFRVTTGLSQALLERLASADALGGLGLDRRQGLWAVRGMGADTGLPLFEAAGQTGSGADPEVRLPAMRLSEEVVADYQTQRLSLKAHPMSFLRARHAARGIRPAQALGETVQNQRVQVSGVVLVRQRPGTAQGVVFMTIEDETGTVNIVIWKAVLARFRRAVMTARLVRVSGVVQRAGEVIHVIAGRIDDLSDELSLLSETGDMPDTLARADEVKRPEPGSRHPARASHPRNVRILPRSRDFH